MPNTRPTNQRPPLTTPKVKQIVKPAMKWPISSVIWKFNASLAWSSTKRDWSFFSNQMMSGTRMLRTAPPRWHRKASWRSSGVDEISGLRVLPGGGALPGVAGLRGSGVVESEVSPTCKGGGAPEYFGMRDPTPTPAARPRLALPGKGTPSRGVDLPQGHAVLPGEPGAVLILR